MVSDAGILWPGTWIILNLQGSIRCFKWSIILLVTSWKEQSPNILKSSFWYVVITKSSQPRLKNLESFNAQAWARASPSINAQGCLLNRLLDLYLEPVIDDLHEQYFCWSQYPTPVFDQSDFRHAFRLGSNMQTPCSIALMISSFEKVKASSSYSAQENGTFASEEGFELDHHFI